MRFLSFRRQKNPSRLAYGDITNRLCAVSLDLGILYFPLTIITQLALAIFFTVPDQFNVTRNKVLARFPDAAKDVSRIFQLMVDNYPRDLELIIRQFIFVTVLQLILIAIYMVPMLYKYGATLGKMALGLKVVDIITEGRLTLSQCIIRFIGYIISVVPLFLGIFYGGLRRDKRCWHDFLGDTVVIYNPNRWYKKYMDRGILRVKKFFNIKH